MGALEYLIVQGIITVNCDDLPEAESPDGVSEAEPSAPPVSIEWIKQHIEWSSKGGVSLDEFIERHPYHPMILKSYMDIDLAKQEAFAEYKKKKFVSDRVPVSVLDIYEYIKSKAYQKAGLGEDVPMYSFFYAGDLSQLNTNEYERGGGFATKDHGHIGYTSLVTHTMDRQYVDGYQHKYVGSKFTVWGRVPTTLTVDGFHSGVELALLKENIYTVTDSNGQIITPGTRLYAGQYTIGFNESIQQRVGSASPYSYEDPPVLTLTVVELPLWLPGDDEPEDSTPPELANHIKQIKHQLEFNSYNHNDLADSYEQVDTFIKLHPHNLEILESYIADDLAAQRERVESDGREWNSVVPDAVLWEGIYEKGIYNYVISNTYRDVEPPPDLDFIPIGYWFAGNTGGDDAYLFDSSGGRDSTDSSEFVLYVVNRQYLDSLRFLAEINDRAYTATLLMNSYYNYRDYELAPDLAPERVKSGDVYSVIYPTLPPGEYRLEIEGYSDKTFTVVELPLWRP